MGKRITAEEFVDIASRQVLIRGSIQRAWHGEDQEGDVRPNTATSIHLFAVIEEANCFHFTHIRCIHRAYDDLPAVTCGSPLRLTEFKMVNTQLEIKRDRLREEVQERIRNFFSFSFWTTVAQVVVVKRTHEGSSLLARSSVELMQQWARLETCMAYEIENQNRSSDHSVILLSVFHRFSGFLRDCNRDWQRVGLA